MTDFERLLSEWANWALHTLCLSQVTVSRYISAMNRFALWFDPSGDKTPAPSPHRPKAVNVLQASQSDVETYVGIHAHWRKLKPQSRLGELAAIKSFFAYLNKKGGAASPAADVRYPRFGRPLPKAMALGDAEKVMMLPGIKSLSALRDTCMMAVLFGAGLRLSGLMAMTDRSLVWWHDAGRERLTLKVIEKGKKERLVPVGQETALLIRAYMGHAEFRAIDRQLPNGDAVLWVTTQRFMAPHLYIGKERQMHARTFQNRFERYCTDAGVEPGFRKPHSARHLYGTELAENDVDVITRQALMGHADPKTTEIYTHLAQRKLVDVVDKANPVSKMRGQLLTDLRALGIATTTNKGGREL